MLQISVNLLLCCKYTVKRRVFLMNSSTFSHSHTTKPRVFASVLEGLNTRNPKLGTEIQQKPTTIGILCFCRGVRSTANTTEFRAFLRIHHETQGFRDALQSSSALPHDKNLEFLHVSLVRMMPKPCFPTSLRAYFPAISMREDNMFRTA